MNENLRAYVPDVEFELIPIKNLVSNQDYQRNLSQTHIARMVANFDIHQINLVKVSRRDGVNLVMNGQHTIETVAAISGSRETPVWCMIYQDLDYQSEADIFANQMKYSKALSAYEVFVAHIEAGHDEQLLIKSLVESYNYHITSSSYDAHSICAVSALEYVYEKYGYQILDHTLYLIASTWEGDPMSFCGSMIKGIAKLLDCFEDELKLDDFVERMGRISPKEIIRSAKEHRNGILGYAEALLAFYNRKLRQPLNYNKLYHHSASQAQLKAACGVHPEDEETMDDVQNEDDTE